MIQINKDWRNKSDMSSNDFESNLKNLKGTFAVESMTVSEESIENLKRIDSGKVSYTDVIEELKLKFIRIYQSAKPDFNPNVEYMKDPLSREIPSVDNSLFILARKFILE